MKKAAVTVKLNILFVKNAYERIVRAKRDIKGSIEIVHEGSHFVKARAGVIEDGLAWIRDTFGGGVDEGCRIHGWFVIFQVGNREDRQGVLESDNFSATDFDFGVKGWKTFCAPSCLLTRKEALTFNHLTEATGSKVGNVAYCEKYHTANRWIRGCRASGTVCGVRVDTLKVVRNGVYRAACGFDDDDVARLLIFLGFRVGETAEFGDVFHSEVNRFRAFGNDVFQFRSINGVAAEQETAHSI